MKNTSVFIYFGKTRLVAKGRLSDTLRPNLYLCSCFHLFVSDLLLKWDENLRFEEIVILTSGGMKTMVKSIFYPISILLSSNLFIIKDIIDKATVPIF